MVTFQNKITLTTVLKNKNSKLAQLRCKRISVSTFHSANSQLHGVHSMIKANKQKHDCTYLQFI